MNDFVLHLNYITHRCCLRFYYGLKPHETRLRATISCGGYILNKYDGENSDVIAENVHTYHYIAPDCILMITNCNSKSKEGVLSVYNGKECITLSDHVQAVS